MNPGQCGTSVLARTQATLVNEKLATKQDLDALESRLKGNMREMELRLTYSLTVRFGSMMVIVIGVIAALVKLL